MSSRTHLEQLTAARPAVLDHLDDVIDAGEQERILRRILVTERPAGQIADGRRCGWFPKVVAAAAVAAACAVAIWSIVGSGASPAGPPTAPTLRLAGYTFHLPRGFAATDAACTPTPAPPAGSPVTPVQSLEIAGSAAGGCIEGEVLSGTDVVPPSASAVQVGSYDGFQATTAAGNPILYVAIPPATAPGEDAYLVLTATGLTPAELVAVAASGLPAQPGG